MGNGEKSIFETQTVRFGSYAEQPKYQPTKVNLPSAKDKLENSKTGLISPFKDYGAAVLGPITGPKTFVCTYDAERDIREIASPETYFEFIEEYMDGYRINLKENVTAEAIIIPSYFKAPNGITKLVTSFTINSKSTVKTTLKRVFV